MAVSVRDVAAAASVSVGTVSNVLNHPSKVAPATVERVLRVIDELGFVRNDAARQLRAGHSRSIGLVVPDVGNPFFAEIVRGAQRRAAESGLVVLVGSSDDEPAQEDAYLRLFREQRVNGVLVTPAGGDLGLIEKVRDAGTPVVLVDQDGRDTGLGSVAVDNVEGGYLAAMHLLGLGRRRVACVCGPLTVRQVAERLEGARRAISEVPDASLEVIAMPALTVLQGRAAGAALVARDPRDRPDAVFAANDLLAVGLLQALTMLADVRVPEDVALIGYDDIDFAAAAVVPLSSIRQPAALIGRTGVDLLLADAAGSPDGHERNVRFRPELVARQSTQG